MSVWELWLFCDADMAERVVVIAAKSSSDLSFMLVDFSLTLSESFFTSSVSELNPDSSEKRWAFYTRVKKPSILRLSTSALNPSIDDDTKCNVS